MSDVAAQKVRAALDALWEGSAPETAIIGWLRGALAALGADWTPPKEVGSDGGYVPADDDQPTILAGEINRRLATLQYYDGETALDGPYRIWGRAKVWYQDSAGYVLLIPMGDEGKGAVLQALLHWTQYGDGSIVPDDTPPYPGPKIGWQWADVTIGADTDPWVVTIWLTGPGVAVRIQQ